MNHEELKDLLGKATDLIGLGTIQRYEALAAAVEQGKLTNLHGAHVHTADNHVGFRFEAQFGPDWSRHGDLAVRIDSPLTDKVGHQSTVKVTLNWSACGEQRPASAIRVATAYREAAELACAVEDLLHDLEDRVYGPTLAKLLQGLGDELEAERKRVLSPPEKKGRKSK